MSRTMILTLVLVAIIAAAIFFGVRTAQASTEMGLDEGPPPPKPEPIFKPLPPGQEKFATVETAAGPVTLVQRYDTSGTNPVTDPVAVGVSLASAVIKPGLFSGLKRL
jgi:hypothetical protein